MRFTQIAYFTIDSYISNYDATNDTSNQICFKIMLIILKLYY
jgi:hypothetical protein